MTYFENKKKLIFLPLIILELLVIIYFLSPLVLRTITPFLIIKSDSMLPVLKVGDVIMIKGIDSSSDIAQLQNKIIAFYNPAEGKIYVHRVVGILGNNVITKGDNSDAIDFFQADRNYILGELLVKL
jgi:signal peptidase I